MREKELEILSRIGQRQSPSNEYISASGKELELLARIEELERHTWRNSAILRAVAMVSFTALIGIIVASGVVGGGRGNSWNGPAWNTMWLYGLFAANAVSMFWTTHKE